MRSGFATALLVVFAVAGASWSDETAEDGSHAALTLLSFNVRSARGDVEDTPRYDDANLDQLVALIEELRPDAVLLQEVDRGVARSRRVDQFEVVRSASGMQGAFARTVDYQGGRFGIAVLTRHEIVATNRVRLPRLGGKEPRALQHLRIRLEGGAEIDLFNTHVDPRPVSRDRQIDLILGHTSRLARGPAILAGDFNAAPGSTPLAGVAATWNDAAVRAGSPAPTYPARDPAVRVDYVFYRGEGLELHSFTTLDARGISDHRPLLARFVVRP